MGKRPGDAILPCIFLPPLSMCVCVCVGLTFKGSNLMLGGGEGGLTFKGSNFLPLRHILCFPTRPLLERAMFSKKGEETVTKSCIPTKPNVPVPKDVKLQDKREGKSWQKEGNLCQLDI